MKVLFYHLTALQENHKLWEQGMYPGHLLYGLTHLPKNGIECIAYEIPFNPFIKRFRLSLYNTIRILFYKQKYDAIYAVAHRGLEPIIMLRALGLFRKPIFLWHHTAVVSHKKNVREILSSFFYRGVDRFFFFSKILRTWSIETKKVSAEKAVVIHWGADTAFYNRLENFSENYFVSTGKAHRDYMTLIKAFEQVPFPVKIYSPSAFSKKDFGNRIDHMKQSLPSNIVLNTTYAALQDTIDAVAHSFCVLICCLDYPYTIGLTTLVEAMALGKPVITTDNETFPIDVEKEGFGIKIPHGDVNAWVQAVTFLCNNPEIAGEMGQKGKALAEKEYNLERFAAEISHEIFETMNFLQRV